MVVAKKTAKSTISKSTKGGRRPNAGRPIKYNSEFKSALVNDVGLLKAQHPSWTNQQILSELIAQNKINKSDKRGVSRLLEKRFNTRATIDGEVDIREIFTTPKRIGILQLAPRLSIKK